MKRIIVAFVALATLLGVQPLSAAEKRQFKYVDATTLTIVNRAQEGGFLLNRIETEKYPQLPGPSMRALRMSTGLAVVFRTNSRVVSARWTNVPRRYGNNMTPILQRGLDLYVDVEGRWVFAGVGRPSSREDVTKHSYTIVDNMAEGEHLCLLYLPMWSELTSLEIGVEEGASIVAAPSPFKHKVVVVGSSITHGASATRSGMCYVSRLNRSLGVDMPNIGISGRCKLDDYFADIICDTKADAFLFDAFSNPTAEQIDERLYGFVAKIRKAHPETPLIFMQTGARETGNLDLVRHERSTTIREAAARGMAKVCKDFKNVYFINPGLDTGADQDGTIDGAHPSDLGFDRALKIVEPKIRKILKKHGIK